MDILEINFEVERSTAGLEAFVAAVHVSVDVKSANLNFKRRTPVLRVCAYYGAKYKLLEEGTDRISTPNSRSLTENPVFVRRNRTGGCRYEDTASMSHRDAFFNSFVLFQKEIIRVSSKAGAGSMPLPTTINN
jgi:hypothetical protein